MREKQNRYEKGSEATSIFIFRDGKICIFPDKNCSGALMIVSLDDFWREKTKISKSLLV